MNKKYYLVSETITQNLAKMAGKLGFTKKLVKRNRRATQQLKKKFMGHLYKPHVNTKDGEFIRALPEG